MIELQGEQIKFFDDFKHEINQYMISNYPLLFDKELSDKLNKLEDIHNQIIAGFDKWRHTVNTCDNILRRTNQSTFIEDIQKKLKKWIEKDFPALGEETEKYTKNLNALHKKQEKIKDQIEAKLKDLEEKMKEFVQSKSLCEDVYKVKDDIATLMKTMDKMHKNMKNALKAFNE